MENNQVDFDESFGGDSKCDILHSNPWQVLCLQPEQPSRQSPESELHGCPRRSRALMSADKTRVWFVLCQLA